MTRHRQPDCVAKAISVDNLSSMQTISKDGFVTTDIQGNKMRSIIASVDDYLVNLTLAEELCR
jgi:hypothetical protein